jgi:hypothetical protein
LGSDLDEQRISFMIASCAEYDAEQWEGTVRNLEEWIRYVLFHTRRWPKSTVLGPYSVSVERCENPSNTGDFSSEA